MSGGPVNVRSEPAASRSATAEDRHRELTVVDHQLRVVAGEPDAAPGLDGCGEEHEEALGAVDPEELGRHGHDLDRQLGIGDRAVDLLLQEVDA